MSEEYKFDDLGNLCAFIHACGGKVYSWKRFKIAVYTLSKAGRMEPRKRPQIFSYGFSSNCYAGPDDDDLREDLDWLRDAGYLTEKIEELYGASGHNLYELTDKGKELGLIAIGHWITKQKKAVFDVANVLKDPSNSVMKLLQRYANKWDRSQGKVIEKL